MLRTKLVTLLLFLAFPILLIAETPSLLPSYELSVRIEPNTGGIAVSGIIEVVIKDDHLRFDLHETMTISKLLLDGKAANFTYTPMVGQLPLPATRGVAVALPAGVAKGRVRIQIEYAGRMKVLPEFGASPDFLHSLDDQVNSRMVELAGYSSWYPQFGFGQKLQLQLAVSLPENWIAICSGKKVAERIESGRVLTRWSSPRDGDIVILASQNYKKKTLQAAGFQIELYYTQMPVWFMEQDAAQIADVLKLYSGYLGDTTLPGATVKHVFSPKRKGQGKAGFARPGLIVTSEGITLEALGHDPKFSLFQGVAHEIAHYWWNFGFGQGDWINEAFAEYFSAIAVQKLSSEKEFLATMIDYRNQVTALPMDAPSLSTVPEWTNFVVRYYKGSLMLDATHQTMGDERFFQACREFFQTYTGKPIGTAEFSSFWKAKLNGEKDLLDSWLDSQGGLVAASR